MFDNDVFAADPRVRWEAAQRTLAGHGQGLREQIRVSFEGWPKYWWGVANAWLVFLGPSPGNSKAKPIDWDRERWPTLGEPHEHFVSQVDSTGFWPRMRQWTVNAYALAGVFVDDPEAAIGSTLLANVLDTREGDAGKIDDASLVQAMPTTVAQLSVVRPRLIVPMEKRITRLLLDELTREGSRILSGPSKIPVPALNQRYPFYRPAGWEVMAPFGRLTIAESPQHPSKRNFYDPAIVDRYLSDKIQGCLS